MFLELLNVFVHAIVVLLPREEAFVYLCYFPEGFCSTTADLVRAFVRRAYVQGAYVVRHPFERAVIL